MPPKEKPSTNWRANGAATGNRTPDSRVTGGHSFHYSITAKWSVLWDSNPRYSAPNGTCNQPTLRTDEMGAGTAFESVAKAYEAFELPHTLPGKMAGKVGLEPTTSGFSRQHSTN